GSQPPPHEEPPAEGAQPLAPAFHEHDDSKDPGPERKEGSGTPAVADHRRHERQRLPAVADRPQPERLLADRLTRPQRLADPEVAEDDDEAAKDLDQVVQHRVVEVDP